MPRNKDAEVSEHVETVRSVEIELAIDAETVRNTESEQSDSEDENTNYVGSESEQSDSPFEDSDNDLVDDDLVCDVQVSVGRDIPGFRASSSEDSDGGVDSEAETKSLHIACDFETEVERNIFPKFNSAVDIENPKFKKGLLFSYQKIFKAAMKQYAVKNMFNIRLKVNDSARVQAVCNDGYLWMVWASKMHPKDKNDNTWQIKTYVGEHNYVKEHNCVRDTKNRNCTFSWLAKECLEKFRVDPNYFAKSLKHDVMKDHMVLVQRSKCIRAKKLALEMIVGNQEEQYARIYDYLGELRGTNPGRTTICHLDNRLFLRIYPLAFAIVESETRDSWTWFLQILETDLKLTNSFHYTSMSDKQKWTDAMNELKAMSEQSFNWLVAKDPRNWSKAHLSTNLKSEMLLNNLCESFNKMILESRDKPILTMMEMIRCKIMTQIAAKKEAAEKIIGTLCPKIQTNLDKILEQSIRCWPRNAGGQRWEVSIGFEDQHAVDLEAQTCSSRKWDLTGIPCIHVASDILHIGARPEDFVNPCYRKETQLKIYSHMVKPLRGLKQKRRKEPDEPVKETGRLTTLGVKMTCSKCGSKGHNKRSCRGQVGGNARAGRNARPNKSNTSGPMPTAHARQSSTMPTARATTSKLSVRRKTWSNSATSSHPSNIQHHQQESQRTLGPPMVVRWMPSQ
ncbi:hypothetical protein V6N13_059325 [Hibiscus sabdariffa]